MFFSIGNHFGPFSLCFSIRSHYGGERRELGCREIKKKEKRNRKIRIKGKYVFFYMCFFNRVCREIEGV